MKNRIEINIPLTDKELTEEDKKVLGDIAITLAFQFEGRVELFKINFLEDIKNIPHSVQ